ncbi:hypothetical protein PSTG_09406 [Puccinia striiformis f. sp. tritici PST-78]|uniref:C2 DOCK-type domain-containing protein n=1 Tax=Puccinia striiformis f. sp. tritici PST-78 TaxID=1165861 RepID=A0A0L0VDC4_9BASI|nr:hypothetical protein PSTG_09406 [Puccinia striiformis f. sp. tritici PST-78]
MTRGMRFTSSFGLVISLTLTSALPKLSLLLDQEKIVVAAALRTNTGLVLERVISRGSGEPKVTRYNSMVYRNNHTPTWGELMKLDISSETIEISQSDKPFAFSYLPLFSANRTFIPDGEHNLILFIYDEQSATPEVYSRVRPTFVPGQLIPGVTLALSKLLIPLKDSFVVRSFLCSTLHTQDEILLRLMKWNTLLDDPDVLRQTLTKLKFASEVEICKFLTNIFDPLFGVLVCWANAETKEYGELVFYALVTLLGWNSLRPSIYQLQACSQSLHRSSLRLYNRLEPPFTIFSNLTK